MIIKVKWLPWILLIGGIIAAFAAEEDAWMGYVAAAIGVLWLVAAKSGSSSNKSGSSRSASSANSNPDYSAQTPNAYVPTNNNGLCPKCGYSVPDDMVFCSKCGTRVR